MQPSLDPQPIFLNALPGMPDETLSPAFCSLNQCHDGKCHAMQAGYKMRRETQDSVLMST